MVVWHVQNCSVMSRLTGAYNKTAPEFIIMIVIIHLLDQARQIFPLHNVTLLLTPVIILVLIHVLIHVLILILVLIPVLIPVLILDLILILGLIPAHIPVLVLARVLPEDAYGHVLEGRLNPDQRSDLMQNLGKFSTYSILPFIFLYLSICLSFHLTIYLSVYLFIYLSIYFSIFHCLSVVSCSFYPKCSQESTCETVG